jgi:uncharacterized membrane protein (UPF0127 family)
LKKAAISVFAILAIIIVSLAYLAFQPPNTAQIRIKGIVLIVDLATTPAEQEKGLSGRESMPPNKGMLFIFTVEGNWGFWMNGMKFPLDIIWFNSNREAVFIEQNLQPCGPSGCPIYSPPTNATYVLEVNAGFVAAHNISLGDTFTFVLP